MATARRARSPAHTYKEIKSELVQEDNERNTLFKEAIQTQNVELLETVAPHIANRDLVNRKFIETVQMGKEGLPLVEVLIELIDVRTFEDALFTSALNNEERVFNYLLRHPIDGIDSQWIYDHLLDYVDNGYEVDSFYFDQLKSIS